MTNERKEIVRVSGPMILIVMVLLANVLIAVILVRYHDYKLFALEKAYNQEYVKILLDDHMLKQDIIKLEGVSNWNETMYAKTLNPSASPANDQPVAR